MHDGWVNESLLPLVRGCVTVWGMGHRNIPDLNFSEWSILQDLPEHAAEATVRSYVPAPQVGSLVEAEGHVWRVERVVMLDSGDHVLRLTRA